MENITGYTPGPWKACCNGECDCGFVYGPEYIVAVTQRKYDDTEINKKVFEANARLIAAAPEMAARIHELEAQNAEMLEGLKNEYRKYCDRCKYHRSECSGGNGCRDELKSIIETIEGRPIEEVLK